ncbi:hypothetical protein BX600DRAFT_429420 [Xylariales sp. PMI_506]|nr:hypothetical protein BX600DRAFT_429420 [Xylariales sp. PMI_506]
MSDIWSSSEAWGTERKYFKSKAMKSRALGSQDLDLTKLRIHTGQEKEEEEKKHDVIRLTKLPEAVGTVACGDEVIAAFMVVARTDVCAGVVAGAGAGAGVEATVGGMGIVLMSSESCGEPVPPVASADMLGSCAIACEAVVDVELGLEIGSRVGNGAEVAGPSSMTDLIGGKAVGIEIAIEIGGTLFTLPATANMEAVVDTGGVSRNLETANLEKRVE